ncbi:MAG: anthranilate phosphoribosyltransferase [Pseudomonadota bacterium]
MTSFQNHLNKILQDTVLNEKEMSQAMSEIMTGAVQEDHLEQFLISLSNRGEAVSEITGGAKIMREMASSISSPDNATDCCGTGGDGQNTYNISTAVAFVCAACGIPMAKHGNRAASSKSGAADVLEALGIHLDLSKEQLEQALNDIGFCFLMAPAHHQAMKHVVPVRKKIGKRTIFNLLGPLANPANTKYQLMGVYDSKWVEPIAKTLKNLGTKSAWVVHGQDGLDEITTTAETNVAILKNDEIEIKTISPEDFGLNRSNPEDLKGGNADENAEALLSVLNGEKNAYREIVVANAAAVICIHNPENSIIQSVKIAQEAIDNHKALDVYNRYKAFSNEAQS